MTATKDRFWAKVLFKEFIRHYRKMTPEQKVADIDESMDALEELDDSGESFGAKMVRWSMERVEQYPMARANGKKGGRPRKETTGDAPHREAGDESATISNNSQDAPSGNAGEAIPSGRNAVQHGLLDHPAPNMRRVPQNEAPAHGFSGGRAARGTMSPAPDRAVQSGKFSNDQETDQVSTDGPRQAEAREGQGRTGGSSARGMAKVAQSPVRSLRLPTWDEFTAFIDAQGLDYTDARQWWEMTMVDREGNDRYGKPIGNWKAALKRFCAAKINNRRTA